MENNNEKQAKSGRVSKLQRRRLLELMQQHRHVGKGQFVTKDAKKEHSATWEAVSKELNAMGGSLKKPDQWKKSWIDWKSSVKQQYGRHRAFKNRTGNLPASEGPKPIEGLDKEVLDFFSKDAVDGDGHTVEAGLEAEAASAVYEDIIYLDDSQVEVLDVDCIPEECLLQPRLPQQQTKQPTPQRQARAREPSSQSCLEEVKKVCGENHTEIMGALNKIINLIENQNETLAQVLICLQNKN